MAACYYTAAARMPRHGKSPARRRAAAAIPADPPRARRARHARGAGRRPRRSSRRSRASPSPPSPRVVEPLEELQHRISRVWSPVNHLNGVLNSEALRASYNTCLPLLSDYHTDLAQSEPLYRAYAAIAEREGAQLGAGAARRWSSMRCAISASPASASTTDRKRRFKSVMLELTQLQSRFDENVLDAMNAWTHHVDGWRCSCADSTSRSSSRRWRARRGQEPAGLAADAGPAHLRRRRHGRANRKPCAAPSTKPGTRAHPTAGRPPGAGTTPP